MLASLLTVEAIREGLSVSRVGRLVRVFDELPSTNLYALDPALGPESDGLVILTEKQTAGRGRHGRSWECPRGAGILCTVLLFDRERQIEASLLALVVPVAIREAIRTSTGVDCSLKWPNDLVTPNGKLAGVLIESADSGNGRRYAIGMGINCLQQRGHFSAGLNRTATSLELESDQPIDRVAVLRGLLAELDRWLAAPQDWDADSICESWRRAATGIGSRITVRHAGQEFTGNVIDIDPSSGLLVDLDQGVRRLFAASNTTVVSGEEAGRV